ncbi:undecaprenyl-phosphate galactose phosphotransferase WbaP [Sodalis sp. RH20]|uniref:undecaprenyl-phosphate galactose phosphotransferase WbaP n=1 Tax=unclassified Sodalis (in: enterobacteria) TaxID=2636512 RepID=UPI0039B3C6A1
MSAKYISLKTYGSKAFLAASDFIFFNLSAYIAIWIIHQFFKKDNFLEAFEVKTFTSIHLLLSVVCVGWFWVRLRHYTYRKPFWFELKEIFRTLLIFSVISLALVGFAKEELSRYIWLVAWLLVMVLVPLGRSLVKRVLNIFGWWLKQTIIIGNGKNAYEAYQALQSEEVLGFRVEGFYSIDDSKSSPVDTIPLIKSEEALWNATDPANTQFIVALEYEQNLVRDYWLKFLAKNNCRSVSVIPTLRGVPLYGTDMSFIFSHEVMILRVSNNLAKRTSRFIKRAFDIFGCVLILLFLAPILLIIMKMVAKDKGPIFYGHERVGMNGAKFKCYKFRSMVVNSKEVLEKLLASDINVRTEWERDFKLKNDPRVTKIGAFLRKTSLDELPQLWNVLEGNMSLVGPRPVIEEELERYAGDVDYYLMAKPGMTGLWQVSGRSDVDYETRVYFDAWYVKNWSLWNDIAILFKTVKIVLKKDGAY